MPVRPLPDLVAALSHADSRYRSRAAEEIERYGRAAMPAMLPLADALTDPDRFVRLHAARALVAIGPDEPRVRKILNIALRDEDDAVQQVATDALAGIEDFGHEDDTDAYVEALRGGMDLNTRLHSMIHGPGDETRDSMPAIIKAMGDPDVYVRSRAVEEAASVGFHLGLNHRHVFPVAAKLLRDDDEFVRLHAAEFVGECITDLADVRDGLVANLGDPEPLVRVAMLDGFLGLRENAEPALPAIVRLCDDSDARVRLAAARAIGRLESHGIGGLPALLRLAVDPSADVARQAVYAIGQLGEEASSAGPTLQRIMTGDREELRAAATEAIGKVGPFEGMDVSLVVALLDDPDDNARAEAAAVIEKIGPAAKAAQAALLRDLSAENGYLRYRAVKALGAIGADYDAAFPALLKALKDDESENVHEAAAEVIGMYGPRAVEAVPVMVGRLLNPPEPSSVCMACAGALGKIGDLGIGLEGLAKGMHDNYSGVQEASAAGLCALPLREEHIPLLVRELSHDNSTVREILTKRVATFGDAGVSALLALEVSENDWKMTQAIESAVASLGAGAVPHARDMLASADPMRRQMAFNVLQQIGGNASAAVPTLVGLLQRDGLLDGELRHRAAYTMGRIGFDARSAAALLLAIQESDPAVAYSYVSFADALSAMGEAAIPTLVDAMRHADPRVRLGAASAMREMHRCGAAGVPALVAGLDDPDADVRRECLSGLATVGVVDASLAPRMIPLLGDQNYTVRNWAAMCLGHMGDKAPDEAISALVEAIERSDEYDPQPDAFGQALASIGPRSLPAIRERIDGSANAGVYVRALARLGDEGIELVLPRLLSCLDDPEEFDRRTSSWRYNNEAVRHVRPLLDESDPRKLQLGLMLTSVHTLDASGRERVWELTSHPDREVMANAVGLVCGDYSWRNELTADDLRGWLTSKDARVRRSAAYVCSDSKEHSAALAPELLAGLAEADGEDSDTFISALYEVPAAMVKAVKQALADADRRRATIKTLGRLPNATKLAAVAPKLLAEATADEIGDVLDWLAQSPMATAKVVPLLVARLAEATVRTRAARAIAAHGKKTKAYADAIVAAVAAHPGYEPWVLTPLGAALRASKEGRSALAAKAGESEDVRKMAEG